MTSIMSGEESRTSQPFTGNRHSSYIDVDDLEVEEEVSIDEPVGRVAVSTYRMRPGLRELFPATNVKRIVQHIMFDKLQGKVYNPQDAGRWSREIADEVSVAINERVTIPRYKYVVQTTLGQQLGAGCRYIAKCCWDAEADSHVSDVFTNATLFCVCTVFGVYLY